MNMKRRTATGKIRTSGCVLALLCSLVAFASAASAATCTPVVIAFRHAEDSNPNPPPPIFTLTPTGMRHAELYTTMVPGLTTANNFCKVTKVYAATKANKVAPCGDACASATNAFDTAAPLAKAVMSHDPITTVGGKELYEYLGNGNEAPKVPDYNKKAAVALRSELLETANRGESSAIFWTSQGLHVLGGAIINGTSNVPDKNAATNPVTPPRNSVYVFEADTSAATITKFSDIVSPTFYVQCFNHVEYTEAIDPKLPQFIPPTGSPPIQAYYCGFGAQSDLGGKPGKGCAVGTQCSSSIPNDPPSGVQSAIKTNKDVLGKICNTTKLSPDIKPAADTFGACN